jgi:FMN phosphatase YigB (HAD superfamily)
MDTFLFDLDGTLLWMDQDKFMEEYFKALIVKMAPYGIETQKFIKALWAGIEKMLKNDGKLSNEEQFWNTFAGILGEEIRSLEPVFEDFYRNEFNNARSATRMHPAAAKLIAQLKNKGYKLVLATNPLFPSVATYNRIGWAGLKPEDFDHITTYENSHYSKPNLKYYNEILEIIGKEPSDCIMVGNDTDEDMCVSVVGMDTYLLKDCFINRSDKDISGIKQGYIDELLEFVQALPSV